LLKHVVDPLPLTLTLTLPLHLLGWALCQVEAVGFVLVGRVAAVLEVGLRKFLRVHRLELRGWVLALIMVQRYVLAVTYG
jgi:hypothetical protein